MTKLLSATNCVITSYSIHYTKLYDVIELELTLQPKLLEANPFLEDVTGQVGIQRGPVVYCLESHDLPEGVKISDVVIPQNIKLTSEYRKDELAGVTVLKGKVLAKPAVDWDNRLYAEKPFQSYNFV